MMTCPERLYGFHPSFEAKENLDDWEMRDGKRVCSFCGSMHPDDFYKACEEACSFNSKMRIDSTDKAGKFYVYPHKFYNYHSTREEWEAHKDTVVKAVKTSWNKMFPPEDGSLPVSNSQQV
jgi:hypothetical protein